MKKVKYHLNEQNEFVIDNYHNAQTFADFFPGVAGLWGRPIWVFYTNRGQAISSFGTRDKENPIMEFYPANKAYINVSTTGFRTIIKVHKAPKPILYDAFNSHLNGSNFDISSQMLITPHELTIKEANKTLGLDISILYFTIPNDDYGALARIVTIRNIKKNNLNMEILDGIPQVIPYGFNNWCLKYMSNTAKAWIDVLNLENKVPFAKLRVETTDSAEVIPIDGGNFYVNFDKNGITKPIVDPRKIFGQTCDFVYPEIFASRKVFNYPKDQSLKNNIPCFMSYKKICVKPGASYTAYSLVGNMDNISKLNKNIQRISKADYILRKKRENRNIIQNLTCDVFTHSASKSFDLYCAQNFLDNVLRGGKPLTLRHKDKDTNLYVFSRKHGDMERDYNNFLIEPNYFSQGNGNFRDVNQNRRNDCWFNPNIGEDNILSFFNLLQSDGHNPLVIKPVTFVLSKKFDIIKKSFQKNDQWKIEDFFKNPFTIGGLFSYLEKHKIALCGKKEIFLQTLLTNSEKIENAEHSEGFWSDHWHYCLDLLESYLRLYPEKLKHILLDTNEFRFYISPFAVKPRDEKYVLKGNRVYQIDALRRKRESGMESSCKTTLLSKMLVVIANKFASLDPFGVGVEMSADRPGWCDSLNGLPGLLGSSTCETFELKRWILFVKKSLLTLSEEKIQLPMEAHEFFAALGNIASVETDNYLLWDSSHTLREEYLEKTSDGFKGVEMVISSKQITDILEVMQRRIDDGLKKSFDAKSQLYFSYFINQVTDYKIIKKEGNRTFVKALKFEQKPLPLYLEGIVHYLKTVDTSCAQRTHSAVKRSDLFDKKLHMYKINAPLGDTTQEIGRSKIFTPGWLENESIWTHMEYKYILEVLKSGLHNEFYEELKNVLIPFNDPARYKRSILENSSFIVSSAYPQKELHGAGFYARLSGATAEFIHMWLIMCAGQNPFSVDKNKKLLLSLNPILPNWLFTEKKENGFDENTFAFKFLGKTLVVYHNPNRKDTYGKDKANISRIIVKPFGMKETIFNAQYISDPISRQVREGKIEKIDVFLE
jgi:hypothetical protein